MTLATVNRLLRLVDVNVNTSAGTLGYLRTVEAITALCNATDTLYDAMEARGEDAGDLWYVETDGGLSLPDTIVAAYWHACAWQAPGAVESALQFAAGTLFRPGMTGEPKPDEPAHDVFANLADMATAHYCPERATEGGA